MAYTTRSCSFTRAYSKCVFLIVRFKLLIPYTLFFTPFVRKSAAYSTKKMIETYLDACVHQLDDIVSTEFVPPFHTQHKIDFLVEAKESFGITALILEGGSSLGNIMIIAPFFNLGIHVYFPFYITKKAYFILVSSKH